MAGTALIELPSYRCHKEVKAARITEIKNAAGDGDDVDLVLGDIGLTLRKDYLWVEKFCPMVGGYLVEYNDGYQSFSPASAFEDGYTLIEG